MAGLYVIIAGAGKVGWNLARELIEKGHEVTVIEQDRRRYLTVEQELEHAVQYGDSTELWVLERAGIQRADLVVAVTGDDEDNLLICQVAKEKYLCERIIARVNNPRNLEHFKLLGIQPAVSATDLILRLIEHEVPRYGLVHLLDLPEERLEIIELVVSEDAPAAGTLVSELGLPEGALVISVLRDGSGFVPKADTVVEAGDEVLVVLDPGLEDAITAQFVNGDQPGGLMAERNVDILIVGGGLAGASCAEGLREAGFEGSVLLAGREPHPPYERPPCSKDLLRGESEPDDAHLHPDGWYEEHDIELLTRTSVMKLDPATKTAELAHIGSVDFDRALLATGANIRRLRVEGGDHDGIHYLRTLGTSVSLREDAADAEQRRADRRLLHRLRGRGLADHARQAVHAGDARGRRRCRPASARPRAASSPSCSARTGSSS